MDYYNIRAVCLNGHEISQSIEIENIEYEKFCEKCGAEVIISCPNCSQYIKGASRGSPNIFGDSPIYISSKIPEFCPDCGKSYPWANIPEKKDKLIINSQQNMNDKLISSKKRLEDYMQNIDEILKNFTRTTKSCDINSEDQYLLHTIVNELHDLLNSIFGSNIYTTQIIDDYNRGKENYFKSSSYSSVSYIKATLKAAITKVQEIIDNPEDINSLNTGEKIFIGHGASLVWRELKDFIKDRLKLPWEEFNRVSPAGKATKEQLEIMLMNSCFAFLIMTAEDEQINGDKRARENVVHEVGLFQGKLGFNKAIIVLEDGCKEFSNIEGIGQIRFPKNKISSKFEDIRMVLEREKIIK